MNTADYANQILIKHGANITQAAKSMGVTRMSFYNWLNDEKPYMFSDEHAIKAAEVLDLDKDEVLRNILLERTKCPEARALWERMFSTLPRHAAGIMVFVVAMSLYIAPAQPGFAGPEMQSNIYYVK